MLTAITWHATRMNLAQHFYTVGTVKQTIVYCVGLCQVEGIGIIRENE